MCTNPFRAPSVPAPAPAPTRDDPSPATTAAVAEAERTARRRAAGNSGTILTSGMGDAAAAPVARKTLLGQ